MEIIANLYKINPDLLCRFAIAVLERRHYYGTIVEGVQDANSPTPRFETNTLVFFN